MTREVENLLKGILIFAATLAYYVLLHCSIKDALELTLLVFISYTLDEILVALKEVLVTLKQREKS